MHRDVCSSVLISLAVLSTAVSALAQSGTGETITRTLMQDGYTRSYDLYIPAAYGGSAEWPLVVSFHGFSWTVENHAWLDGMNAVADTAHFLVARPRGLPITVHPFSNMRAGWNTDGGFGEWDDVALASRIIDDIDADYKIDLRRVHATGFSFGSMMSFTLACQLADRIASIAAVAGPLVEKFFVDGCPATRPISVLQFHGTADPIHSYTGYVGDDFAPRPIPETFSFFARHNGCSTDSVVIALPDIDSSDSSTPTRIEYPGCEAGTEIVHYRIENGGHTWPQRQTSNSSLGTINFDVDATAVIWEFLQRHPHPSPRKIWNTTLVGYVPIPEGNPTNVAADGTVVAVGTHLDSADSWSILVDINDPTNPVRLESTSIGAVPVIEAATAYTLHGAQSTGIPYELRLFDIADPGQPVHLAAFDTNGDAAGLAVRNGYAYVALENSEGQLRPPGLLVVDVTDPTNPTELSFLETTPTDHQSFAIDGNFAYLASPSGFGSERGLHIVDITDPRSPAGVLFDNRWGGAGINGHGLAVNGDILLVRNGFDDYWDILDVADRLSPTQVGVLPSGVQDVQLVGNRAYVAAGSEGLNIFDLSDASDPALVGFYTTQGSAWSVAATDNYVFLVAEDGLYVFATEPSTGNEESPIATFPRTHILYQNYPNPFNPATAISYALPQPADAKLSVFDLLGRQIRVLASGTQPAGTYEVSFDATGLPSGVYFYRLEAGDYVETKRLVVVK